MITNVKGDLENLEDDLKAAKYGVIRWARMVTFR